MKTIVYTPKSPEPIGPYSQAVAVGDLLFISGQIPFDNQTDKLVLDSIESQTKVVMQNIQYILEAHNLGFEHVVKTSIFLTNMGDFSKVNEVYASFFKSDFPARETVQVSRLPKDVNIEISVIASSK